MNEKENYAQCISNAKLGETGFSYTLSLINSKEYPQILPTAGKTRGFKQHSNLFSVTTKIFF